MPKEGLSVYFSGVDKMSPVLATIADKTRALDKASQELQQTYDAMQKANQMLNAQRAELKSSLETQRNKVSDLRAEYKKYNDDMSGLKLKLAIEEQDSLKDKLKEVEDQLKANRKAFNENREEIRKGLLEDPEMSQGTGLGDIAKGIFAGQIGQMFASSLGGLGQSLLTSAIGMPEASLISNTLSGAISGGAAGAMFGPPGVLLGAGLGGLSGLISSGTEIFEAKDDAFKAYYGGLYEDVSARSGEMVESGSTIAGGREQTRMAFSQRLGGDKQADDYLAQVEKMAASTNYEYDEIVGYAKLLLNSYKPKEVFGVLQKLSDATAGLDLSSGDVNMMISGLSRMRTTGKTTQEYLNYFRERGVDTDQALADALTESTGKTVQKSAIADMVHDGDISGEFAAQAILDFIQQEFGGLSDTLAGTYDAMVDNLGDINASLEARGGDAYNELRKEGVEAEMNALSGELGDAIGEINAIMGENQARKENMQEQYMREALEAVLLGKEGSVFNEEENAELAELSAKYAELKARYDESSGADAEAGAQMGALYKEAQMLGQAYFDNSDYVQMLNDTEIDEIEAIRDATAGLEAATTAAYKLQQELSKGLAVTYEVPTYMAAGTPVWYPFGIGAPKTSPGEAQVAGSHAFGLERVPYNDYPALLHEGERVLTASQARAQDAGQSGALPLQITVSGNYFTGTPEEMADQLAEILARKISQAVTAAAPK